MKFPVKENKFTPIDEGTHFGKIVKVEYRHEPFEYTDVFVTVDDAKNMVLKYGCPSSVTTESRLGKLLALFGGKIIPGEEVSPEKILMRTEEIDYTKSEDGKTDVCVYKSGKEVEVKVKFMTVNEVTTMKEGGQREFARVVENSLKPINVSIQPVEQTPQAQ